MRLSTILTAICAAALAAADPRTADIYIQPIHPSSKPAPLASISYDTLSPSTASLSGYEPPELPEEATLLRIGVYDRKSASWASGTTVAAAENFAKGFSPQLLLSVTGKGEVVSAAVKGVKIDAGITRDFGPQVQLLVENKGKLPELNKPIVLSPEGKKIELEEKTFLQK